MKPFYAQVEAVDLAFTSDTCSGRGSSNTKLLLNGQDITTYCRSFSLRANVDEIVTATIEVLPRHGFELRLPVGIELTALVEPGFVLIEDVTPEGKRWRVEREKEPEA